MCLVGWELKLRKEEKVKHLVVSDLHGISFESIYEEKTSLNKDIDKIVLLGDYFDSTNMEITGEVQLERFERLLKLKEIDSRIELLLGNHDAVYLYNTEEEIKSFGRGILSNYKEIGKILDSNIDKINICYEGRKFLYSHSGITNTFMIQSGCKTIQEINDRLHKRDYKILEYEDGLKYISLNTDYKHFEHVVKDRYRNLQVIGHFANKGLVIHNGIIGIESVNHANAVVIID